MQANFIAAFLFGIWHIVMPIRSYIHGEMSFSAMVLMGIGYMIRSGIREFVINGSELFDKMDNYTEWCRSIDANTKEETVNPDWVVTDTFFAVDDNGRIVGIIDLRHTLNDFLKDLGNCGYSVRPSERRKGIATEMLRQLLDVAKKAGMKELHLSVEKDNEPSVKTIIRNGGVFE